MKKDLAELVSRSVSIKSENNHSDNDSNDEVKAVFDEVKTVLGGMKDAADELADVFGNIVKGAESNGGNMPDVNDIARQVLENEIK